MFSAVAQPFSNGYWAIDLLRVMTALQFGAALLFLPGTLRNPYNTRGGPIDPLCGTDWLSAAMGLLVISALYALSQHWAEPMVWHRTPFLLGAGIALNVFLYRQRQCRKTA